MSPADDLPTASRAPLRAADLRGLSRLGVDATVGVTDLVEAMHHTIAARIGVARRSPEGRTSGQNGRTAPNPTSACKK